MFESANGRALAAAMPRDRVVPESDGPFAKVAGKPIMPWNALRTAEGLGPLWGLSNDEAAEALARNGCTLLRTMVRG
jgi:TatD DNase family protein